MDFVDNFWDNVSYNRCGRQTKYKIHCPKIYVGDRRDTRYSVPKYMWVTDEIQDTLSQYRCRLHTIPKVIDFPRYYMKCSGENVILRGIVHVVSGFPLHFTLYRGNLDCFFNNVDEIHYTLSQNICG